MKAEELAQKFHETYERLAPSHGYTTRTESAKPWSEVPENNKKLMIAVCEEIIKTCWPDKMGETSLRIGMIIGTLWGVDPNACEQLIKNETGDFRYVKETQAVYNLYKTVMGGMMSDEEVAR